MRNQTGLKKSKTHNKTMMTETIREALMKMNEATAQMNIEAMREALAEMNDAMIRMSQPAEPIFSPAPALSKPKPPSHSWHGVKVVPEVPEIKTEEPEKPVFMKRDCPKPKSKRLTTQDHRNKVAWWIIENEEDFVGSAYNYRTFNDFKEAIRQTALHSALMVYYDRNAFLIEDHLLPLFSKFWEDKGDDYYKSFHNYYKPTQNTKSPDDRMADYVIKDEEVVWIDAIYHDGQNYKDLVIYNALKLKGMKETEVKAYIKEHF